LGRRFLTMPMPMSIQRIRQQGDRAGALDGFAQLALVLGALVKRRSRLMSL